MNRRNFLQFSTSSLLLSGCQTAYSPYEVDPSTKNRNERSIQDITNASPTYPISIALISDTHDYYTSLDKVLKHIKDNEESYDFVLHGGDITDAGLQVEFDIYHNLIANINRPFVHGVGNHDALTNGIFVFQNSYGFFDFTFKVAKTHFIYFNNNNWEFGGNALNFTWLQEALEIATASITKEGGQIIVVNHVPFNDHERFSEVEIEQYANLIDTHNVSLSINGHLHSFEQYAQNDTTFLTIGSVSFDSYVKLTLSGPSQFEFSLERVYV